MTGQQYKNTRANKRMDMVKWKGKKKKRSHFCWKMILEYKIFNRDFVLFQELGKTQNMWNSI